MVRRLLRVGIAVGGGELEYFFTQGKAGFLLRLRVEVETQDVTS